MGTRIQYAPGAGRPLPEGTVALDRHHPFLAGAFCGGHDGLAAQERVDRYRAWLRSRPSTVDGIVASWPGFSFACVCGPDDPCLGDVLAKVAAGGAP